MRHNLKVVFIFLITLQILSKDLGQTPTNVQISHTTFLLKPSSQAKIIFLCEFGYYNFIMANIKYFGFAKESASVPVLGLILQQSDKEDIKIQATKVLAELKLLGLRVDQRQKIKSHLGSWHTKKDAHNIIYIALCSSNYPERHIYSAFNQLREHLSKLGGEFQEEPDSTIRLHAQSQAEEICKNFQNLKTFDKTTAVKAQIEEVKAGAIENFTKMTDNTEQMQNLSNKSDKIKQNALLFEQRADDLQNKMNRRNCKIRVIMGISLISLLLLILVPIITKRVN